MKIAYNPDTAAALTAAPANNDITFDLKGLSIYVRGKRFKGTDTTYSVFKKHTSSSGGGYAGLVPVPSYTTTAIRYLREDGTWSTIDNVQYTTLTNQSLNDYKDAGKWYNAGGGNSVTNKPSGVDGFEMYVGVNGSVYRYQKLISDSGLIYFRQWNNSTWGSWKRWYTDANTDSKVTQTYSSTDSFRPVLLGETEKTDPSSFTNVTNQVRYAKTIYAQTSTGYLYATKLFSGGTEVLTAHQSLANYVTLNTAQTITGLKTFSQDSFGAMFVKRNNDSNGAAIGFRGSSNIYGYIGLCKEGQLQRWSADTNTMYSILDVSTTYIKDGKITINGTSITPLTSLPSHTHTYIVAEDLRAKYPNSVLSTRGMKISFLAASTLGITNDGTYYDTIMVKSYGDSSGGSDNALLFGKQSDSLYHTRFAFGSTDSWGTPLLILDTANYSTYAATKDHTHTTSLATDTGTPAITLAHGSVYKLTAGGTSVIFKMPTDNNTKYNFSGTYFYSGNSSTAEHDANKAVKNGHYYYTSNGPSTDIGASTTDGALYVQAYSDSWVGQIAQDYRNGRLFFRGKNNGTWQSWITNIDSGNYTGYAATKDHTHSVKINGITKTITSDTTVVDLGTYLTSHQSLANYVTLNTVQTITANKTFNSGCLSVSGNQDYVTLLRSDNTKIGTAQLDGAWRIFHGTGTGTSRGLTFYSYTLASDGTLSNGKECLTISPYSLGSTIASPGTSSVTIKTPGTITSSGFLKSGSSNSYVLLGGGGHKALSQFITTSNVIDNNLTTITKSLTITSDWMDTGISSTDLPANGTYIVQVSYTMNDNNAKMYQMVNSGVMSWYRDATNDIDTDEILLHRAGHACSIAIYLRTIMQTSGVLKLQISASETITAAFNYTFKFKRVI